MRWPTTWASATSASTSSAGPSVRVLKVVAYVTRGRELLVFTQPGSPWEETGIQVPAGTVYDGEPLEQAHGLAAGFGAGWVGSSFLADARATD
jgi:hypothetical protein